MRAVFVAIGAVVLAALATFYAPALVAQSSAQNSVPHSSAKPICLKRKIPSGHFLIVAPSNRVPELAGRGFEETPCRGRDGLVSDDYRAKICRLAASGSDQTLALVERSYGISPKELCELAGGNVRR